MSNQADVKMDNGTTVRLKQETRYPWDGAMKLTVSPEQAGNSPSRFVSLDGLAVKPFPVICTASRMPAPVPRRSS